MKQQINLDIRNSLKSAVGKNGITNADLKKLEVSLKKTNKRLLADFDQECLAFLRLPDQKKELLAIQYQADKTKKNFENLIVVGIGGSDLGARAALAALKSKYHNELTQAKRGGMRIYFAGDTTDPQPLKELIETVDLSKTAIQVISKSGETIETLTAFAFLREALIKKVGKEAHKRHIIATTGSSGSLYEMALKNEYDLLTHPPVGGRFSVLSCVGLFALACAGIEIDEMLRGAKPLRDLLKINSASRNPAFAFAAINFLAYKKNHQNILVLMPYAYKLAEFGKWFRQLWAESLGKDGLGQTPVAALGPTDQHSQLQLYQEGLADKIITFLKVADQDGLEVPKIDAEAISYFSGHKFSHILEQELSATAKALAHADKPNNTLTIAKLDAYHLGQLFFFFELAVVYSADLFKINPFDQPGVELSKKILHKKLR